MNLETTAFRLGQSEAASFLMRLLAATALIATSEATLGDLPSPARPRSNPYQRPAPRWRKDPSKPKRWETPAAFAKRTR